ncbi:MAG: hypothetical protein GY694_12105 [Gammaproteobacteria bacterium]|nr:hypothetical protein [Gammaproteobacteria bacterium]
METEENEVSTQCANKRHQSLRRTQRQFVRSHDKTISIETIRRLRRERNIKPFHRRTFPFITNNNKADRLALCDWFLNEFKEDETLADNLVFFDEFYVYLQRKHNSKNDIIWFTSPDAIPEHIRLNRKNKKPGCVGVFVLRSPKTVFIINKGG